LYRIKAVTYIASCARKSSKLRKIMEETCQRASLETMLSPLDKPAMKIATLLTPRKSEFRSEIKIADKLKRRRLLSITNVSSSLKCFVKRLNKKNKKAPDQKRKRLRNHTMMKHKQQMLHRC